MDEERPKPLWPNNSPPKGDKDFAIFALVVLFPYWSNATFFGNLWFLFFALKTLFQGMDVEEKSTSKFLLLFIGALKLYGLVPWNFLVPLKGIAKESECVNEKPRKLFFAISRE